MTHFSDHQLQMLTSAEGKTLKKVMIYFWVNRLNPNAQIDLIDNPLIHIRYTSKLIL